MLKEKTNIPVRKRANEMNRQLTHTKRNTVSKYISKF